MYGYIYMTINVLNGKRYIGQKISDKFLTKYKYAGSGMIIRQHIKNNGVDHLAVELLDTANSKEELDRKEIYWIEYYNAVEDPMFYNLAEGGNRNNMSHFDQDREAIRRERISNSLKGRHHSEETKRKISLGNIGNKNSLGRKHSEESKRLMSIKQSGSNNPMYDVHKYGKDAPFYGHHHSDEARKKISEASKNRIVSEETRRKLSRINKGRVVSEETRRKISNSIDNRGDKNPCYGRKRLTNDGIHWKMVRTEDLEFYLNNGYVYWKDRGEL